MASPSSEVIGVPLFDRKWVKHSDKREYQCFMVRSALQPFKLMAWWTKEGYDEQLSPHHKDLPEYDETRLRGGFVNGRPMINPSVPVNTCAGPGRPKFLYRVVHDGQPHYGQSARGYGIVVVTPLYFQMHVEQHMNWRCRTPSPFLSATGVRATAKRMVEILQRRGCTGIRILTFRTTGPGWDHSKQRLFNAYHLSKQLHTKTFIDSEYLIESHIPPESIINCEHVDDLVENDLSPKSMIDTIEVEEDPSPGKPTKRKAEEDLPERGKRGKQYGKRSTHFMRGT